MPNRLEAPRRVLRNVVRPIGEVICGRTRQEVNDRVFIYGGVGMVSFVEGGFIVPVAAAVAILTAIIAHGIRESNEINARNKAQTEAVRAIIKRSETTPTS